MLCLLVTLGLVGCNKPVTEWSDSMIESWIKKEWELSEVTVTSNTDGTFSATGKNDAGTAFTFRIEKKPDLKELHCIRLSGDATTADAKILKSF